MIDENKEMFDEAEAAFQRGDYSQAESILNQLILRNHKGPEVFHMLGTIYYDRGKFNKAIHSFRRALEINPAFTDASVGLSIILNDLGRYEEGKNVFEDAREMLNQSQNQEDPFINEKLAIKHDELGELYLQYQRPKQALEQYYKALELSTRKTDLKMKVAECFALLGQEQKALNQLKELKREYPKFLTARLRLGEIFFEKGDVPEAVAEWEAVLQRDPDNNQAQTLLHRAKSADLTTSLEL